ncbi:hypothetical protein D3C80_708090 [compost metagenome]
MTLDDIATNAGNRINRALATPVEVRKGAAFFAAAIADMPVMKQRAVGAHAREIMQRVNQRNAALADHRPDQRRQFRERMGIDHIRPEIIDDTRKPANEARIQLHGDLVVFSLPFRLLPPVADKERRGVPEAVNGETVSLFRCLLFTGDGGHRDRVSFIRKSTREVFHEYFRTSHPIRSK